MRSEMIAVASRLALRLIEGRAATVRSGRRCPRAPPSVDCARGHDVSLLRRRR